MTVFRRTSAFDHLPLVVKNLLVINFLVFIAQIIFQDVLIPFFGLTPVLVLKKFWIWQLFTYAFLHGNFWHLFFNMFALWMFGPHVENALGTKRFIRLYAVCVLGAALTQMVVAPYSLVVGASGGMYGVLLAFGLLYPDAVIYLLFIFPLRAIQAVLLIAVITLASAIGSGGSRVAHFAHLGGLLTAFLFFKIPVWRESFRMWRMERMFRHPRGRRTKAPPVQDGENLTDEVDQILDKISTEGIDSLTAEEHQIMERYAKKKH